MNRHAGETSRVEMGDEAVCVVMDVLRRVRANGTTARCARHEAWTLAARSTTAIVPQIDHRVGHGLECVVQLTDTIEAK